MSYVANRFTVLLDANVLYPNRKRDILLSLHEAGLFRARWTDQITEEWTRNLKKKRPDLSSRIDRVRAIIELEFPDSVVTEYNGLAELVDMPDNDNRHVLAAAIRCGAQIIVTDNLKHFPANTLGRFDIEALSADHFLTETFGLFPFEALSAIKEMRMRYKNKMTSSEFLMDLNAKGMPLLAAELRAKKQFI